MTTTTPPTNPSKLTYLAIGDSYTIGEAVAQHESFPFQLVAQLKAKNLDFATPKVVARTGWTTSELQEAIKAEKHFNPPYSMVTLLIGVNNQYRGESSEVYRREFKALLQTAIDFTGGDQKRVFVVSIPDWGVTPFGKNSGRSLSVISREIDLFNAINEEETLAKGVSYTSITTDSRRAAEDLSLVAEDGLHPSGKMYHNWATALLPKIQAVF